MQTMWGLRLWPDSVSCSPSTVQLRVDTCHRQQSWMPLSFTLKALSFCPQGLLLPSICPATAETINRNTQRSPTLTLKSWLPVHWCWLEIQRQSLEEKRKSSFILCQAKRKLQASTSRTVPPEKTEVLYPHESLVVFFFFFPFCKISKQGLPWWSSG